MNDKKCLKIIGNKQVNGVIKTSGSKNAALPLIAASLFLKGETILKNVPDILDVRRMLEILKHLNVKYQFKDNVLKIDSTNMEYKNLDIEVVKKLRGAYYYIPPLLKENSSLLFYQVGGCSFEKRPIDLHLDLIKSIGGKITYNNSLYQIRINKFNNLHYTFKKKSLGATINAILLGIKTQLPTTIINYSIEPEVICVIDFLKRAGLEIKKDDKSVSFQLKTQLKGIEYEIIPDRIEAETFGLLGLGLGRIGIFDFNKEHHLSFLKFLDECKIVYTLEDNYLLINKEIINEPPNIKLDNYPFLSTDIGPILLSFLLLQNKMFIIKDEIYPTRLNNLKFYKDMFYFNNYELLVNPIKRNKRNNVFYGSNLRDTMAYLYYALTHDGEYFIYGYEHLIRGYENIIDKLISLNCSIEVLDEED